MLLGAILIGCSNQTPDGFVVKGKIKNADNKKIYLSKLAIHNMLDVDSTIVKKGKFELKGTYDEPNFYLVRFDNQHYIYLIVDSTDKSIEITADANDLIHTYQIKGSPQSVILQQLVLHNYNNIMRVDTLSRIYQANTQNPKLDSIRHELDKRYRVIYDDERKFLETYIEKNKGNFAGLMALYQQLGPRNYIFNPNNDLKYYEMVDNALNKAYPNSAQARQLHSSVLQIKAQQHQQQQQQAGLGIGMEAPEIAYPNPDGKILKLSSLRGKYVLVDFWASWCRPCRAENPNVVANYKKYHNKGFEVFQVSLDRSKTAWQKAIQDDGLGSWYHVSDLKFWDSEPAKLYGVRAIPSNFLLDKDGKIIAKNLRGEALGRKLQEIFGQ
jgi:peroxiredoxin